MHCLTTVFLLFALFFGCLEARAEITVSDSFCEEGQKQDPMVKVLLKEGVTTALVESRGAYDLSSNGVHIGSFVQGKRAAVHALYENLRWGEQVIKAQNFTITSKDDGSLFVNGIQYKGVINVSRKDGEITLSIVNEVSVEEFLRSILSVKYLQVLSKEALSAFVILERTSFYERLLSKMSGNELWHVKAEEENYFGYGVTRRFFGVEEAVDWTTRLILDDGAPLMNFEIKDEISEKIVRLAGQGLNAKQILEIFWPAANFVVIDKWDGSLY